MFKNAIVRLPCNEAIKIIYNSGYEVITVDVSEFRKFDGGLSCLSLRWISSLCSSAFAFCS